MATEIRPFDAADVDDAARLLATRHRRHRQAAPLLDPAFESAATAGAVLLRAWDAGTATGSVAFHGRQMVGYLLGASRAQPVWGPNVWVESAGQAVADGFAETLRDLYAAAAARWVEEGRTAHYVVVPAHDPAVAAAWFRVGFGHQHTHALRRPAPPPPPPPTLTIRLAEHADIPVLAGLELELPRHQALSPCFSSGEVASLEDVVTGLEADLGDPDYTTFVAEQGGRVVGAALGCDLARSSSNEGLIRPETAGFLGFAAVLEDARRLGAGRALGEAVIGWCAEQGYPAVATDWRQTNLLSSRAWPALGFADTFWRLHRTVGY